MHALHDSLQGELCKIWPPRSVKFGWSTMNMLVFLGLEVGSFLFEQKITYISHRRQIFQTRLHEMCYRPRLSFFLLAIPCELSNIICNFSCIFHSCFVAHANISILWKLRTHDTSVFGMLGSLHEDRRVLLLHVFLYSHIDEQTLESWWDVMPSICSNWCYRICQGRHHCVKKKSCGEYPWNHAWRGRLIWTTIFIGNVQYLFGISLLSWQWPALSFGKM